MILLGFDIGSSSVKASRRVETRARNERKNPRTNHHDVAHNKERKKLI